MKWRRKSNHVMELTTSRRNISARCRARFPKADCGSSEDQQNKDPNIQSERMDESQKFYEEFVGLEVAMDMGWDCDAGIAKQPQGPDFAPEGATIGGAAGADVADCRGRRR